MARAPEQSPRNVERAAFARRANTTGLEHILVCLDRSALAEANIPYALTLARAFGARLTLMHVVETPRTTTPATPDVSRRTALHEAQVYLQRVRERTGALGVTTDTLLAVGDPATRIAAAGIEIGVGLTLLGSHGEHGQIVGALGNTARRIVALARGSVFVARALPSAPAGSAPRRILVPLDGSTRTECVLPAAARVAQVHGAELVLAHVVSEPVPSGVLPAGEDLEQARDVARRVEARARGYLGRVADALAQSGAFARTTVIRDADARQALLELAEREEVQWILLSAHGTTCNPARPFGSVAAHLMTHARAALLVAQDLRAPAMFEGDFGSERRSTPLGTPSHRPTQAT